MNAGVHPMENTARLIFAQAVHEERAGELLQCLFDGGSATLDEHTGVLVLISKSQVSNLRKIVTGR